MDNSEVTVFCKSCGSPLSDIQKVDINNIDNVNNDFLKSMPPKKNNNGTIGLIAGISVAVISVCICIAVLFLTNLNNKSDNTESANTSVAEQTTAELTTNKPAEAVIIEKIVVPDVIGLSKEDAQNELKSNGLDVVMHETESDTVSSGYVISQSPLQGSELKKGDSVTIYISKISNKQYSYNTVYTKPYFSHITASSTLESEQQFSYEASNLRYFDDTCWCEGVDGSCVGEYVIFSETTTQAVSGVQIVNGYAKDSKAFYNNGRVTNLRFEFSDGTYIDKYIYDDASLQTIDFGRTFYTNIMKVTILQYKNGAEYNDICISYINPF